MLIFFLTAREKRKRASTQHSAQSGVGVEMLLAMAAQLHLAAEVAVPPSPIDGIHGGKKDFAVVHVSDGLSGIARPYQASIFAMHQRLKETGSLLRADHVLLLCSNAGPSFLGAVSHHEIKVRRMDCPRIDAATTDKGFHQYIFYKLAIFRLTEYSKVVSLDLDMYVAASISGVFDHPPPAMVRWESSVAGPFQANSATLLVQPSIALYEAALGYLRRIPSGSTGSSRVAKLYEMMSPWGAFYNKSEAVPPDAASVLAGDSDQQFFLMLFNVLERKRFGPLNELPYAYNVKHFMLYWKHYRSWTSRAFLTFMSLPEQGHIRVLHFNRDKPWTNAWCGPFHASFWRAAERAVEQVNATRPPASHAAFYSRNLDRLSSYVRAGRMLEEQRPCKRGAKPVGEFVKLRSLERRGTITSKKIEYLRTRAARAGR